MKHLRPLFTLFTSILAAPVSGLATPIDLTPDAFWYLRLGYGAQSRLADVPEGEGNGVTLRRFRTGTNLVNTNAGLVFQTPRNHPYTLRTRFDFIGRSDGTESAWKSFSRSVDYDHFPLAWHRSERTLRANAFLSYSLTSILSASIEGEYEDVHSGSDLGNDSEALATSPFVAGRGYFVKPGVRVDITDVDQVKAYSLIMKRVYEAESMDSYRTDGRPLQNLGLMYRHLFQDYGLALNTHVYQYSFIFNDPFKDFARRGLTLDAQKAFLEGQLQVGLHGSFWRDQFDLPMLGVQTCGSVNSNSTDQSLVSCSRTDQTRSLGTSVAWRFRPGMQVELNYDYRFNANSTSKLAEFEDHTFLLQLSFGRVSGMDLLPQDYELGREAMNLRDGR